MKPTTLAVLALGVSISACQTTAEQAPDDPIGWARFDCQRASLNPQLEAELDRAKLICVGKADAAAVAGTANMRPGYGIGGAIAAGIAQGTAQAQISNATVTSCMAELGYQLKKRSEYEVLCPVPPPKAGQLRK